jgi:class 3 adenylate cyclase
MAELPSGTVTFLFTDLEGSTRLWEEYPDAMQPALARHDEILRGAVAAHDGHIVKSTGEVLLRCVGLTRVGLFSPSLLVRSCRRVR